MTICDLFFYSLTDTEYKNPGDHCLHRDDVKVVFVLSGYVFIFINDSFSFD